jgi:hypothetical protein
MLDRRWNGAFEAGVRLYDATAYRAGFTLMVGTMVIAGILLIFARESHCRQMHD